MQSSSLLYDESDVSALAVTGIPDCLNPFVVPPAKTMGSAIAAEIILFIFLIKSTFHNILTIVVSTLYHIKSQNKILNSSEKNFYFRNCFILTLYFAFLLSIFQKFTNIFNDDFFVNELLSLVQVLFSIQKLPHFFLLYNF